MMANPNHLLTAQLRRSGLPECPGQLRPALVHFDSFYAEWCDWQSAAVDAVTRAMFAELAVDRIFRCLQLKGITKAQVMELCRENKQRRRPV